MTLPWKRIPCWVVGVTSKFGKSYYKGMFRMLRRPRSRCWPFPEIPYFDVSGCPGGERSQKRGTIFLLLVLLYDELVFMRDTVASHDARPWYMLCADTTGTPIRNSHFSACQCVGCSGRNYQHADTLSSWIIRNYSLGEWPQCSEIRHSPNSVENSLSIKN